MATCMVTAPAGPPTTPAAGGGRRQAAQAGGTQSARVRPASSVVATLAASGLAAQLVHSLAPSLASYRVALRRPLTCLKRYPVMAIVAVAAVLTLASAVSAEGVEYGAPSVRVEVRVWQGVGDELDIRVSARPADGSWGRLGTFPLVLDDGFSSSGQYRYGDITLSTLLADSAAPATVEVRIWQDVEDSGTVFVSARPAGGSWRRLGTVRLLLDDGFSSDGRYRFGDIGLEVPLSGRVLSLAGRERVHGFQDGQGDRARFGQWGEVAIGLTVDRDGSVVVADFRNHAIRRISPDGTARTIVGGNGPGSRDGWAEEAWFWGPSDVAVDSAGAIYVVESYANRIRKIAPNGMVTTVAGADQPEDGESLRRDGAADEALFVSPSKFAFSADGDLYITEQFQVTRLSPSGWVTTFAGSGGLGYKDGGKEHAEFAFLRDIDVDAEGNVYVLDANPYVPEKKGTHYLVRKIDTSGQVSTLFRGDPLIAGGPLASPWGMAVSPEGEVYLSNTGLHQIVKVLGLTRLEAVAGTGEGGHRDGSYSEAALSEPGALALTPGGALVVMDQADSVVRVVLPEEDGSFPGTRLAEPATIPRLEGALASLFAGGGVRGFADGPASEAFFNSPEGLAFTADGSVIVADTDNHAIRLVSPAGFVSTLTGGNGSGFRDGPPGEAQFSQPQAVAEAGDGTIYVADSYNGLIRRVTPDGVVETVDVEGAPYSWPEGLGVDAEGSLVFTELTAHGYRVRRFSAKGELSDALDETTVLTRAFALGETDTLFFATHLDNRTSIRRVAEGGLISVLFEDIPTHYGGVLSWEVSALALAPGGMLYAADPKYGRVVQITPDGEAAIVVDRGSLDSQQFQPVAILIAPEGNLLVADRGMKRDLGDHAS